MVEQFPQRRIYWLMVCSGLITAVTFKMPKWTGIAGSVQWPIGCATLLLVIWLAAHRGKAPLLLAMLANICGITTGLMFAKVDRVIELQKPMTPISIGTAVFMMVLPFFAFFRIQAQERKNAADREAREREYEAISQLPPEQIVEAFEKRYEEISKGIDEVQRMQRRIAPLIILGMALTLWTIPQALKPEVKPIQLLVSITVICLCTAYLVICFVPDFRRKGMAEEPFENDPEDDMEVLS
jgi:hypothetical protein